MTVSYFVGTPEAADLVDWAQTLAAEPRAEIGAVFAGLDLVAAESEVRKVCAEIGHPVFKVQVCGCFWKTWIGFSGGASWPSENDPIGERIAWVQTMTIADYMPGDFEDEARNWTLSSRDEYEAKLCARLREHEAALIALGAPSASVMVARRLGLRT